MNIDTVVHSVRNYMGLVRKQPIRPVVEQLSSTLVYGDQLPSFGDDAAVIPWNNEYLLLATDGMMTGLLIHEPYAAGKASVMVTVNDIYSMGGRPVGMVNVLASGKDEQRAMIVDGIEKGCHKLKVPMLGGHLHPDAPADMPSLSVAILGHARKLLRSHLAEAGDDLILAVDLSGIRGCRSVVSWDANSGKTPEELLYRLETLPMIAESDLSCACKDISNAGILGTTSIFLENSGKGGTINLDAIPKPKTIDLDDWLKCFQSFGFILSVNPRNSGKVIDLFTGRNITAQIIGTVAPGSTVTVTHDGTTRTLFDFTTDTITGIRYPGTTNTA
ncbi:MAG: AIR synthase related protein [Pseudomonadota bacterium]